MTTNHPALAELAAIVGRRHLLTKPAKTAPYRKGFRYGEGDVLAVVQPGSLYELWQTAQTCVAHDLIIIMQASNTGLTGGSVPYGDYDRPVVLISARRLKGIRLIEDGAQAIALPGATLYELEDELTAIGREPHSVIGSSCIGASIIGGICNNSGGALIHRGPAYTEMALYARVNEHGELELINHLGINLGQHPESLLNRLERGDYTDADIAPASGQTSDHEYQDRVRDIDADTPSRYNNDARRLFEASGSAGRLIVFAVRIDTFAKPERQQIYYIGAHDPDTLTELRRHILKNFKNLPVSGEYMHRDCYDIAERYGRDTYLVIDRLGSKHIPAFFRWKNRIDRLGEKLRLKNLSDRLSQCATDMLPTHLPPFMQHMREQYEHHLILKMADGGVDEAASYLKQYFDAHPHDGAYYACSGKEGAQATLHRFAAAGAANRYHAVKGREVGDLLAPQRTRLVRAPARRNRPAHRRQTLLRPLLLPRHAPGLHPETRQRRGGGQTRATRLSGRQRRRIPGRAQRRPPLPRQRSARQLLPRTRPDQQLKPRHRQNDEKETLGKKLRLRRTLSGVRRRAFFMRGCCPYCACCIPTTIPACHLPFFPIITVLESCHRTAMYHLRDLRALNLLA